jgi:ubiquinone/menaquinone biosynthesis C-methylase UbiE
MVAGEKSRAYKEFCHQVYQSDVCHYNMMAPDQREALLSELTLSRVSRVLDAGCGTGQVALWLHEETGARVTGMDTAVRALDIARTRARQGGPVFVEGNLEAPGLPDRSFDAVVCVDAIGFCRDLMTPVNALSRLVMPGGLMAVFFNALLEAKDADAFIDTSRDTSSGLSGEAFGNRLELEENHTKLARVFHQQGLPFRAIDFSDSDRRFWTACRQTLIGLIPEFERENSIDLCRAGLAEAENALEAIGRHRRRRFLYLADIP